MISNITIHAPEGDLDGIIWDQGIVWPEQDNRHSVVFNGSSLNPAESVTINPELVQLWKKTFFNA